MVFAAVFCIVVGVGMIGQWSFFLGTGKVPELKTEPYRIGFHLAGELLTALALLAGGVGLLIGAPWGRPTYLLSTGMLFYTAVVSPGYFAQRREWPLVGMFAVLLVLAVVGLALAL